MFISNTEDVPGRKINQFFGVVSGSTVRAKHAGRDFMAGLKNIFGGELKGYTELLSEAREEALDRMTQQAESPGCQRGGERPLLDQLGRPGRCGDLRIRHRSGGGLIVTEDLAGLFSIVFTLVLLLVAFFIGEWLERRHYKSIREREQKLKRLPAITVEEMPTPTGWEHDRCGLVTGHVVVSVDHFKRFVAGLRSIFGGRLRSYETLMDRARREAVLRMKHEAGRNGYHAVVNVRLETSALAKSSRQNKKTAGVEVLAFGTGIRMRRAAA